MVKHPFLYLTLALVCILSIIVRQHRKTVCDTPIAYSIGQFDRRFGLSKHEFQETIQHAAQLWEKTLGRDLFTYDPTAPFTISLIFDNRQQATIERQQLSRQLTSTELSHKKLIDSYAYLHDMYQEHLQVYEDALARYEARLTTYNTTVEHWNAHGGAPPDTYRDLADEGNQLNQLRSQLEGTRAELRDLFETLQSMGQENKKIVATYNQRATTYNALYGTGTSFHKGEYNGKAITIYHFHDRMDLTLVMAHELGHALGLDHIDNPQAVMHARMGEQEVDPLHLTPQDAEALKTTCQRR